MLSRCKEAVVNLSRKTPLKPPTGAMCTLPKSSVLVAFVTLIMCGTYTAATKIKRHQNYGKWNQRTCKVEGNAKNFLTRRDPD